MRRPLGAVALAVLLVVAGCTGPLEDASPTPVVTSSPTATPTASSTPTPSATPSPTPTPEPPVEVKYGETGVDATLVFERVERLTGRDVPQPTVYVQDEIATPTYGGPLLRVLGLDDPQFPENRSTGLTRSGGSVTFAPAGNRTNVERTLAHEYVHVVQFDSGMVPARRAAVDRVTSDARTAWQMVVEGGAVFATDAYVREHMPGARLQSTVFASAYADPPTPEARLSLAWYHLGFQYVDARVDDPANLEDAYDPMPTTTEQVLHHESRPREQPLDVSVEATAADPWRRLGEDDRKGELFVRVLLRTELDRERAVGAAAGWGTDRWLAFTDGDDDGDGLLDADGVAWVLRWDTPADAEAFEAAARTYAERRDPDDGRIRVRRLDDDVVALVAGTEGFVANATVGVDDGTVTVDVGVDPAAAPGGV